MIATRVVCRLLEKEETSEIELTYVALSEPGACGPP
jgi:hypothetical protein